MPRCGQDERELLRADLRAGASRVVAGDRGGYEAIHAIASRLADCARTRPEALVAAVHDHEARDGPLSHALSVAGLMMGLAQAQGMDGADVLDLGMGGLLHDIGKLSIPQAILDKPGPLDAVEFALMRRHAERGAALLERCGCFSPLTIAVCRHHHERRDGSGYPAGLRGKAVTRPMQMAGLCDVYDALISRRTYKDPWTGTDALAEIRRAGQFDARLVDRFGVAIGQIG